MRSTSIAPATHVGQSIDWPTWVAGAIDVLRTYLNQEIRLTSYFSNRHGRSVFHTRALANIERLRQEDLPPRLARTC